MVFAKWRTWRLVSRFRFWFLTLEIAFLGSIMVFFGSIFIKQFFKGELMKLHKTKISIPEKERVELIALLNKTLASTSDLQAQLKQAHWNVKGMEFIALHKLFDELAEEVEGQVDVIAERITSLGGTALGTLQEAAKNTQLRLYPVDIFAAKEHLEHLAHNFAILGEHSREGMAKTEELGDMATNDVYVDLARLLDKSLWFIEAHLQK